LYRKSLFKIALNGVAGHLQYIDMWQNSVSSSDLKAHFFTRFTVHCNKINNSSTELLQRKFVLNTTF